jgi:hypothetical protein
MDESDGSYRLLINLNLNINGEPLTVLYNPKMSHDENKSEYPIYINYRKVVGFKYIKRLKDTPLTPAAAGGATPAGATLAPAAAGGATPAGATLAPAAAGGATPAGAALAPAAAGGATLAPAAAGGPPAAGLTDDERKLAEVLSKYSIEGKSDEPNIVKKDGFFTKNQGTGVSLFQKMFDYNKTFEKYDTPEKIMNRAKDSLGIPKRGKSYDQEAKRQLGKKNIEEMKKHMDVRVKILNDNLTFILKVILKQYSILTINGKKYKIISRDVKPPKYYYGKVSQSSKRQYDDEIQYPTIYYDFGNDLSQQKALYKRSGNTGITYLRTDVNVLVREITGGKLYTCDEKYQILTRMFKEMAPMLNPEKKNDLEGKAKDSDQTLINNIMKSGRSQVGGGSSIYGRSKKKRYTKRVKKKKTTRRKRRTNYT